MPIKLLYFLTNYKFYEKEAWMQLSTVKAGFVYPFVVSPTPEKFPKSVNPIPSPEKPS